MTQWGKWYCTGCNRHHDQDVWIEGDRQGHYYCGKSVRQYERTEAGDQALVPGVKPISEREKLQNRTEGRMAPKRRGNQRDCDIGLFGDAKDQLDIADLL